MVNIHILSIKQILLFQQQKTATRKMHISAANWPSVGAPAAPNPLDRRCNTLN